jgi:hypothetical protein
MLSKIGQKNSFVIFLKSAHDFNMMVKFEYLSFQEKPFPQRRAKSFFFGISFLRILRGYSNFKKVYIFGGHPVLGWYMGSIYTREKK